MFSNLLLFSFCYLLISSSTAFDSVSSASYVDGSQHKVKNTDTTYTQRISDKGVCSVQLNEQSKQLNEGYVIQINRKWFKVEDCRLNRAYPAPCSSKLFYQLRDLVCSFVEQHQDNKVHVRQPENEQLTDILDRSYLHVCCESACTVSELLQSCHAKW